MDRHIMDNISQIIRDNTLAFTELRREVHSFPEVGFQEIQTSRRIAQVLSNAGLRVETGIGKTGILATVEGGAGNGPVLMVRADMDGLPIKEQTGLSFASQNGNMHACGHDAHVAIAVKAAEILQENRDDFRGKVVFAFQPAEEIGQGAIAMIEDGLLEKASPDRVIGLHVLNQLPTGKVLVNREHVFASADAFRVTVNGKGGHGALPQFSVDPVVASAHIVAVAQTIISREIPPNDMGVVTFGSIISGSAPNVIADSAVMEGTTRAFKPAIREKLLASISRVATSVSEGLQATASFEHLYGIPPVVNNPVVADWVAGIAAQVAGEENVSPHEPVTVGDDMSEFLNRVPGTYFLLGAAKAGAEMHHNSGFDIDEGCLPIGVEIFVRCALDYLRNYR